MTVRFAEGAELEQVYHPPPPPPKTPRELRADDFANRTAAKRRAYEAVR